MKAFRRIAAAAAAVLLTRAIPAGKAADSRAQSLREFAAAVEYHAAALEESFDIPCTQEVLDRLGDPSASGGGTTLFSEITQQAGIHGSFRYSLDRGEASLTEVAYRAGWKILCRFRQGRTDLLSARERQALEAAQALAAGAAGTDLEKERFIYDRLCERIAYDAREDGTGDKDCALGGLLNGRADCDGYADSMLLCCGLAGVPCRYVEGDSRKPSPVTGAEGGHAWNLVQISGSWLMCDVTWGDAGNDGKPSYLYFNLGLEDAADSYLWEPRTLFTDVAPAADFNTQLMPDQWPYTVYSPEDVYYALRSAALSGSERITLYAPEGPLWADGLGNLGSFVYAGGIRSYAWQSTGRLAELTSLVYPEGTFCFCDTEQDVLEAISGYADGGVRTFSVYFHPALSASLFAGGQAGLQRLLSMSRLENPGTYSYSEESCVISLRDAAFIAPPELCATKEEILDLVRRELPGRPASLAFLVPDGFAFDSVREEVFGEIYAHGVKSLGYLIVGNRVIISNLAYSK